MSTLILPYTHWTTFQDLNCVNGYGKKSSPRARGTENAFLYPGFPRMRTKISDLITHKDFRVNLMMVGHKRFHIIAQFKRFVLAHLSQGELIGWP